MKSFENSPKFHTKQVSNRFLLKPELWRKYTVNTWIDFNFELFRFLPQFKTSIRNLILEMDFRYLHSFLNFQAEYVLTKIVFMIYSKQCITYLLDLLVLEFWYAKLEMFLSKAKLWSNRFPDKIKPFHTQIVLFSSE